MVSVCYAVPTWFSVHFQRPIEHDFRDRASHVGKQVFSDTSTIQAVKTLMHAGELPVQDIADRFGVSRATLYRNAAGPESPKLKTHAIQIAPASEI